MCKVINNSITKVKELTKKLNNYYKLFTFWSEIHAFSRFRRVFDFGPLFGPFMVAFCLLFLTNMADYRQVAARRAHAAAHAPQAHARDTDAFRRMHAAQQSPFVQSFVSMPQSRARSIVRVWLGAAHPRR